MKIIRFLKNNSFCCFVCFGWVCTADCNFCCFSLKILSWGSCLGYCSTAEAACSQKIKPGMESEWLVERKQQILDFNDSNSKILWQLTAILLMISFNGLEGDTGFHAFLSTERCQKEKCDNTRRKESITRQKIQKLHSKYKK